jgi:hypothetical protein
MAEAILASACRMMDSSGVPVESVKSIRAGKNSLVGRLTCGRGEVPLNGIGAVFKALFLVFRTCRRQMRKMSMKILKAPTDPPAVAPTMIELL